MQARVKVAFSESVAFEHLAKASIHSGCYPVLLGVEIAIEVQSFVKLVSFDPLVDKLLIV